MSLVAPELEVVVRQAGKPDRVVALPHGAISVGRAEDNDLVLADIGVSRHHARLVVRADGVSIEDLGSGNGTWCRGRRVDGSWRLQSGDILLIDPFTLELRAPNPTPKYTPKSSSQRAAARARLDVIRGPSLAQGSYLVPETGLSVGRSEYRDLVVLDPAASRHHCDILPRDDGWALVDNGSSNGVHLNDERVTDVPITHGDVLRIGNTELEFVELALEEKADPKPAVLESSTPRPPPPLRTEDDWSHDVSLPAPEQLVNAALDRTPRANPRRSLSPGLEPNTEPVQVRRPPWMAVSLGVMSVGIIALAATVLVGLITVLTWPSTTGLDLPPQPEPAPPSWTLTLPPNPPPATVSTLFNDGVAAMRRRHSSEALRAFYRVLLAENGNRAAERWSFTAGEHLMLDTLELRHHETKLDRDARNAARDELLAKWPRRKAARELRARFRDDPVVLAKTGWPPSQAEANLARTIDRAIIDANAGRLVDAANAFDDVYSRTQNPTLEQRATFGRQSVRRDLAKLVAADWRAGIDAQARGHLDEARAAYQRVLALDPTNPSAKARLSDLGGAAPSVTP